MEKFKQMFPEKNICVTTRKYELVLKPDVDGEFDGERFIAPDKETAITIAQGRLTAFGESIYNYELELVQEGGE